MPLTMTPDVRCALTWGALGLLALLLLASLIWPWSQRMRALDARLERDSDQIARLRALVATLPQLRVELEQVKNRDDTRAFYFSAATPALAGAQLQSEVQDIIRAANARPVSTQILPVDANEQPPRVRIRTQFQGAGEALLAVLYRIEAARPFLFIEQMSLRGSASAIVPQAARQAVRQPGRVPPNERDEITVRLDIFGFVLGGGA